MVAPIQQDSSSAETRRQLLEAAGHVFADVGFRNATVREICNRAGANIAAVNYHFGDKKTLYIAVLKESYWLAVEKYPPSLGLAAKATPEQRLHAFVLSLLLRIFSEGRHSRYGRLMAREMIEPTGALDAMMEDEIQPMADTLNSVIQSILGRSAQIDLIRLCGMSVVSQALFYHHCRPVVLQLCPGMKFDEPGLRQLADHITRFSLDGLRAQSPAAAPVRSKSSSRS